MDILKDILPARHRKKAYAYFKLVGIVLGAIAAGLAAVPNLDVPVWYLTASAVYGYLGAAVFGAVAQANTSEPAPEPEWVEVDEADLDW